MKIKWKKISRKRKYQIKQVSRIKNINFLQKKKYLIENGKRRRAGIIAKLFVQQNKLLFMGLYESIFSHLNKYKSDSQGIEKENIE